MKKLFTVKLKIILLTFLMFSLSALIQAQTSLIGKWILVDATFNGNKITDVSGYRIFGTDNITDWDGNSTCHMEQGSDRGTVYGAFKVSGDSIIYGSSMTNIYWVGNTTNFSKFGKVGLGLEDVTYSLTSGILTIKGTNSYGTTILNYSREGIKADFSSDFTNAFTTIPVNFTDNSSGEINSWLWNFGDGNTSEEQNPSHLYTEAGIYSVSLIVNGDEESDTITKKDYITVKIPEMPVANFTADKTNAFINQTITFKDLSSGDVTEWNWDFGDGNTSTNQNSNHIYTEVGNYTISLTVNGPAGNDTLIRKNYISISDEPLTADFSVDKTNAYPNEIVQFTDNSSGNITSWFWDFGDGTTSTEQHPTHTYDFGGTFTVTLIVKGPAGSDTLIRKSFISVVVRYSWRYGTLSNFESSPAIGTDGTIYVSNWDAHFFAINPDGTLKWKFEDNLYTSPKSSPAIGTDGTVYVGGGDRNILAINPDGTLKWEFATGNNVLSSPAIGADGAIYVGSTDDYLYAINSSGSLVWKFKTEGDVSSSPAIGVDDTIYVGSGDGYLYAINPNGTLKWKYKTEGSVSSSPAIGTDGTIYVGSGDDHLYAINSSGSLVWKYKTEGTVSSSPAIGTDGTIYMGSIDRYIYAINPDGTLKWKYKTEGTVSSSPSLGADGTIYVGSGDRYLYAINTDGTLNWKYKTDGTVSSSPAIGTDGTIYVGSRYYLFAFKSNNSGLANSPWPCFGQNSLRTRKISETSVSIEDLTTDLTIKIYPNPTTGIVQLEGLPFNDKVLISTYNLSGKKVSQFESTSSNAIIDISDEPPGIYLIRIDGKTQCSVKIIKD